MGLFFSAVESLGPPPPPPALELAPALAPNALAPVRAPGLAARARKHNAGLAEDVQKQYSAQRAWLSGRVKREVEFRARGAFNDCVRVNCEFECFDVTISMYSDADIVTPSVPNWRACMDEFRDACPEGFNAAFTFNANRTTMTCEYSLLKEPEEP